jgi:hypothetical protein
LNARAAILCSILVRLKQTRRKKGASKFQGLPMRMLLIPLVVMAWSAGPISGPAPTKPVALPAPAETSAVPAPLEFDALHEQATSALERLRQTHDRRLAMAATAAL